MMGKFATTTVQRFVKVTTTFLPVVLAVVCVSITGDI